MAGEVMDRRVRKTRNTLRACLGKLLKEKKIQEISVKELSEMADINRGTFYLHYRDVYDLLSSIESDVLKQFNEILDHYTLPKLQEDPRPLLCDLFRFIRENADLTQCLMGPNGDIRFLNQLRATFKERVMDPWLLTLHPERSADLQYLQAFVTEGLLGIIKLWLENDTDMSPEKMADMCWYMARSRTAEHI